MRTSFQESAYFVLTPGLPELASLRAEVFVLCMKEIEPGLQHWHCSECDESYCTNCLVPPAL